MHQVSGAVTAAGALSRAGKDDRVGHPTRHVTQAFIHLDHITHNVRLLQDLVGHRRLWPAIKGNAYGHDAVLVARHLVALGYTTLCVAHVAEVASLGMVIK